MAPRSIQYLRKESCYDFTEISGALKALENTTAVPGKEESGADVVVADDGTSRCDMGEMSKALGAVEGTVKKRMKRRRKKLKKRFKKMAVITAEGRRCRRGPAIDFSDLDELWNWSLFSPGNPNLAQSRGPGTVVVPASSPRSHVQSSIQSAIDFSVIDQELWSLYFPDMINLEPDLAQIEGTRHIFRPSFKPTTTCAEPNSVLLQDEGHVG